MNLPLYTIDVHSKYALITANSGGISTTKRISIGSLKELFAERQINTPILPLWCVTYKEEGDFIHIITARNSDMMDLKMNNGNTYKFHYPYIYFHWKITKNGNKLYVTNTNIKTSFEHPNPKAVLYIPRLPNVHPSGDVCFGNNDMNDNFDLDLLELRNLENIFFIGIHNNHLADIDGISANNNKVFEDEESWVRSSLIYKNRGTDTRYNNKKPITLKDYVETNL